MVKITANGSEITLLTNNTDYISLTDIAKYKNSDDANAIIQNWMRNRNTLEFLGTWEKMNNPNFNPLEFEGFRKEAGLNSFVLSVKKWTEKTNAIGIISKAGRYGGTYAHSDIAFEFASWISPEFKLYIIQDYQRLKQEEAYKEQIEWKANRYLAKANYTLQTDAIKEVIVPELKPNQIKFAYSSEADLVNVALFGMTAKQFKKSNPTVEGNQRDNATIEQLLVLNNLQSFNAEMIKNKIDSQTRLKELNRIAREQLESLTRQKLKSVEDLKRLEK